MVIYVIYANHVRHKSLYKWYIAATTQLVQFKVVEAKRPACYSKFHGFLSKIDTLTLPMASNDSNLF